MKQADAGGSKPASEKLLDEITPVCDRVRTMFLEQYDSLQARALIERMWLLRDFNEHTGMTVDDWLILFNRLKTICKKRDAIAMAKIKIPFEQLLTYIDRLQDLAKGHINDKYELEKAVNYLKNWQQSIQCLKNLMDKFK